MNRNRCWRWVFGVFFASILRVEVQVLWDPHQVQKNNKKKTQHKNTPQKKQVLTAPREVQKFRSSEFQVFFVSGYMFCEIRTANKTKHANIQKSKIPKKNRTGSDSATNRWSFWSVSCVCFSCRGTCSMGFTPGGKRRKLHTTHYTLHTTI